MKRFNGKKSFARYGLVGHRVHVGTNFRGGRRL